MNGLIFRYHYSMVSSWMVLVSASSRERFCGGRSLTISGTMCRLECRSWGWSCCLVSKCQLMSFNVGGYFPCLSHKIASAVTWLSFPLSRIYFFCRALSILVFGVYIYFGVHYRTTSNRFRIQFRNTLSRSWSNKQE